jgi:hypothetical protein
MIRNDPLKKYWEEFGKRLKMAMGLMLLPREAERPPEILVSPNASIKKMPFRFFAAGNAVFRCSKIMH